MGSGGWKRVALDYNKERFVQKKGFGFAIKAFFRLMQSQPKKKSFFQRTTTPTSHRNKTNEQQPFSNTACYCELAVQQSIFEK